MHYVYDTPFVLRLILRNVVFWLVIMFGTGYLFFSLRKGILKGLFDPERALYRLRSGEKALFERIRIRRWKDRLPELGILGGFPKDRLYRSEPEYLHRFVRETCCAEVSHIAMGVLGFFNIAINPAELIWLTLPLGLLAAAAQLPFILIQRYNRPRMQRVLEQASRLGLKRLPVYGSEIHPVS